MGKVNIFWFRRDLRFEDNAGLYSALKDGLPVLPVFIFDENILGKLDDRLDPRLSFIYNEIKQLKIKLESLGSSLLVKYGKPETVFADLVNSFSPVKVFTNHDYEPYAIERDALVKTILIEKGVQFNSFKDQVIFEKNEVTRDNGDPYTVFTPYSRKWKTRLAENEIKFFPSETLLDNFIKTDPFTLPELHSFGFTEVPVQVPSRMINLELIKRYDQTRDFPAEKGTSGMSVHLRFGTVSVRNLIKSAAEHNEIYLNELIWREFYMMILWHFPQVEFHSFKTGYERINWRNNETEFKAWCEGMTGYPIVDAGMRELNHTGYMHNRLRMITASFLTKHLLIDWRWGEAYFAKKLLDFELSSNNGGWQWAAGTGCDAAPYFRVFNPALQTEKFDPAFKYIRKWVPEFDSFQYVRPVVDHKMARERAISTYKKALE